MTKSGSEVPIKATVRRRALYESSKVSLSSQGLLLNIHQADGRRQVLNLSQSLLDRTCRFWPAERLMRGGFSSVAFRNAADVIAVARKRIFAIDIDAGVSTAEFAVERGSRPLNIAVLPNGRCFFGEYFSNESRDAVRIFGSDDGGRWEVVHEFPAGEVRHVHGIVHDPHRTGLWVLTGDDGAESGIWYTDDEFANLEPVSRGHQRARAVSVIPMSSGLLVPMDSPTEVNYLHHFDPRSGTFERLFELPGSSFSAARNGDCLLVTTAVETSAVNTDQSSYVFGSIDGTNWKRIARFPRDLEFTRNMRPWLQWPNTTIVPGDGTHSGVSVFCTGLRGFDGQTVSWSRDLLKSYLGT